jgi:hypothetical protein
MSDKPEWHVLNVVIFWSLTVHYHHSASMAPDGNNWTPAAEDVIETCTSVAPSHYCLLRIT